MENFSRNTDPETHQAPKDLMSRYRALRWTAGQAFRWWYCLKRRQNISTKNAGNGHCAQKCTIAHKFFLCAMTYTQKCRTNPNIQNRRNLQPVVPEMRVLRRTSSLFSCGAENQVDCDVTKALCSERSIFRRRHLYLLQMFSPFAIADHANFSGFPPDQLVLVHDAICNGKQGQKEKS